MPYLIFSANGEEFDRRDLSRGAVIVGRAPDCGISIHDILLSRHHCKFEPTPDGWRVTDLRSRNGTHLATHPIQQHTLADGDQLRMGRTHVTFHAGPFVAAPPGTRRRAVVRPADPKDALAGTVTGFTLIEPDEVDRPAGMPFPQPHPKEPSAFRDEQVYRMLDEIKSSSWDSIYAETSQPLKMQRVAPRPMIAGPKVVRPRERVAMCLQAQPMRTRRFSPRRMKRVGLAALSVIVTLVIVGTWVILAQQRPHTVEAGPMQVVEAAPVVQVITPVAPARPQRIASAREKTVVDMARALAPFVLTH